MVMAIRTHTRTLTRTLTSTHTHIRNIAAEVADEAVLGVVAAEFKPVRAPEWFPVPAAPSEAS